MSIVDLHAMAGGSFSKGIALDSMQRIIRRLYLESGIHKD